VKEILRGRVKKTVKETLCEENSKGNSEGKVKETVKKTVHETISLCVVQPPQPKPFANTSTMRCRGGSALHLASVTHSG
jgi:hypothetical protein